MGAERTTMEAIAVRASAASDDTKHEANARPVSTRPVQLAEGFGGPGRDRTDDLFHAMESERQPELCFQVVSNWYIGRKPVYWMIFPANFRPNFSVYNRRAAWAGVLVARFSSRIEYASRGFARRPQLLRPVVRQN